MSLAGLFCPTKPEKLLQPKSSTIPGFKTYGFRVCWDLGYDFLVPNHMACWCPRHQAYNTQYAVGEKHTNLQHTTRQGQNLIAERSFFLLGWGGFPRHCSQHLPAWTFGVDSIDSTAVYMPCPLLNKVGPTTQQGTGSRAQSVLLGRTESETQSQTRERRVRAIAPGSGFEASPAVRLLCSAYPFRV